MVRILKSMPMVVMKEGVKESSLNRSRQHDFPTPESPMRRSLIWQARMAESQCHRRNCGGETGRQGPQGSQHPGVGKDAQGNRSSGCYSTSWLIVMRAMGFTGRQRGIGKRMTLRVGSDGRCAVPGECEAVARLHRWRGELGLRVGAVPECGLWRLCRGSRADRATGPFGRPAESSDGRPSFDDR